LNENQISRVMHTCTLAALTPAAPIYVSVSVPRAGLFSSVCATHAGLLPEPNNLPLSDFAR
jgi:hypothetical protein